MFGKVWTVALAAAVVGVLTLPAPAAYAAGATKPAATKPAMKPMAMKKSHHKMGCYDYAWESAAMKDCLAKGSGSMGKPMKKSSMKKKMSSAPVKKS